MTPITLSPEDQQAIFANIHSAQNAMRDLRDVAEHHRVFGLGDLHRRLSADEVRTSNALMDVAKILRTAEQTEGRV